jgi:hypothetical protein
MWRLFLEAVISIIGQSSSLSMDFVVSLNGRV